MKVYLAAPYAARDIVKSYADELESIGFLVTSSWLKESHEINAGTTGPAAALSDDEIAAHAKTDLVDVSRSDILVSITAATLGVDGGSGGRHIETGYAIALEKPIIVVGQPENIFHRLPSACTQVASWHAATLELARRFLLEVARQPRGVAVKGDS